MPFEPNPGNEIEESTPRWVKVFGIVALILLLLLAVLHLTGGGFGDHAP